MTKYEMEFATKLTMQGRKWTMAPRFKLSKSSYLPDFYLPEEDLLIEFVHDPRAYAHNAHKYNEFRKLYPEKKFIILDINFNSYPKPKRLTYGEKECIHCGYKWHARQTQPKQCPRCKRYNWKAEYNYRIG